MAELMNSKWTLFWDMHSGGGQKLDWGYVFIEADKDKAVEIFMETFGRYPYNVSCECCGEDYSIDESDSLEESSKYHRKGKSLDEYKLSSNVKFIYATR